MRTHQLHLASPLTPIHPKSPRAARLSAFLTLLGMVLCALATSSAAAAATPPAAAPAGAPASREGGPPPIIGATSAAPATGGAASTPAVTTTAPSAAMPAVLRPDGQGRPGAPPSPEPTYGDYVQPQPVVIAQGSATGPLEHPHYQAAPPVSHASDQPIVSSTAPRAVMSPVARPTVTQLASGGSFVASSGSPAPPARPRPPAHQPGSVIGLGLPIHPVLARAPAPIAVSVPLVNVYIGSEAALARHPAGKASLAQAAVVGPSGLSATTMSPFGVDAPLQPGSAVVFGNGAPTTSAGAGAPLLGLNAVLAAMTLLAGLSWRRRSWQLPVLHGESALLSSAPDRPG